MSNAKIFGRGVGLSILIFAAVLAVPFAVPARAQVSGPCANCHTMHNSQNAEPMAYELNGASFDPDSTANANLLITDCIGCHTATDGSTWKDPVTNAPIVFNTSEPQYGADAGDGKNQGLAGGNFYWVTQDDTYGHNIFNPDPNLTEAPGSSTSCGTDACHDNLDRPSTLENAWQGRFACLGCHMMSTSITRHHHADDNDGVADSAEEGWYRFLTAHMAADGEGVSGIEDNDWELNPTATDHNEYLGEELNKTLSQSFLWYGNTMTAFCSGCHGNFHVQDTTSAGASPWLRHPSDQTIPNSGEYTTYTTYDPLIPVARPALTAVSGVVTPGTDMVMCLSCHRAHASPYYKMLRWDIASTTLSTALWGCGKCHSEKY